MFATGAENVRLKRQLASFAESWDRNLGQQGFVSAAALHQAKLATTNRKDERKETRMALVTNVSWTDKQSGERRTRTEWHQLVIWNSLGK